MATVVSAFVATFGAIRLVTWMLDLFRGQA